MPKVSATLERASSIVERAAPFAEAAMPVCSAFQGATAEAAGLSVSTLVPQGFLMKTVVFACVHNAGRSQMAAAFFNALANPHVARAVSAGTHPGEQVHPEVVSAMREVGVDLSTAKPRKLTEALSRDATLLVTMGCGDQCPYVRGLEREDWPLEDPKGQSLEKVRAIREEIRGRVNALLGARRWSLAEPKPTHRPR